ncbi:MAG TPA: M56 family metallopeptidase [Candidatus Dormibacteraeota bacterium]|nr:M56 family metallopeptidase [Candidatus Dormibacteraeota bacterium]
MNVLWSAINQPFLIRVGWLLLHSVWQGAIIGLGFAFARLLFRRRSANTRYAAGCAALGLIMLLPILTVYSPSLPAPPMTKPSVVTPTQPANRVATELTPVDHSSLFDKAYTVLGSLAPWAAALWFPGVAFFGIRLARSHWQLRALRVLHTERAEEALQQTLQRLRCRFEISRPVVLLKSALVEVPTLLGWLRPIILLPGSVIAGLTPAQLEAILAHELAHVRRLDYLVNAAQCFIETIMFYHPIVWWISHSIREEREHCCDDLVVSICGDRVGYARALTTLEEARVNHLAFAASGGSLLRRIRRLLGVSQENGSTTLRVASGLALLGLGLLCVLVGGMQFIRPAIYEASARIKVLGEPAESQLPVMQSDSVLQMAAAELGLKSADAVARLRDQLEIRPIRNTTLLEIRAFSRDPAQSAQIANAAANGYRNHSVEQGVENARRRMGVMQKRAEEESDRMAAMESDLEKLRLDAGIATDGTDSWTETLRRLQEARVESEKQLAHDQTLLEVVNGLTKESLENALSTIVPDERLNKLLQQKAEAEQQLHVAELEYGPEHPEVKRNLTQVESLRRAILSNIHRILLGQKARVSTLRASLDRLDERIEEEKQRRMERALKSQPYFKAKRQLEEAQYYSQLLNDKLAAARLDSEMQPQAAEIVDLAMAPLRPIAPNKPMAIAIMFFGALMDLAGLMVLRSRGA